MANAILWLTRAVIFVLLVLVALSIYQIFISDVLDGEWSLWLFLGVWLFTAYIFLPRIHKYVSKLYVPDYFIGRVRTQDGLLGDPVNLAVIGSSEQLVTTMLAAGWHQAEPLTLLSSLKMIRATVLKRSYPTAPVSSLFLFGKQQDYAFQKEIGGDPRKRHHVRFWATPEQWWLPGGYQVDWLGAATYDKRVGISLFTLQFTHKIAERTDEERDFVVHSIAQASKNAQVNLVEHFTTAYHSRNGGGDMIETDGAMPFIDLTH